MKTNVEIIVEMEKILSDFKAQKKQIQQNYQMLVIKFVN